MLQSTLTNTLRRCSMGLMGGWLVLALPAAQAAKTVLIDFDDLHTGTAVSNIQGVSFSSNIDELFGLDLVVASQYETSSGANYLGTNDGGTQAFFAGDTIDLLFDTPITSLSVNFISTAGAAAGTYSIITDLGSSFSAPTADAVLRDTGEVFSVLFTSEKPFTSAQLFAGTEGIHTFNIDDIEFTLVPIPPAALLFATGLFAIGGVARRR